MALPALLRDSLLYPVVARRLVFIVLQSRPGVEQCSGQSSGGLSPAPETRGPSEMLDTWPAAHHHTELRVTSRNTRLARFAFAVNPSCTVPNDRLHHDVDPPLRANTRCRSRSRRCCAPETVVKSAKRYLGFLVFARRYHSPRPSAPAAGVVADLVCAGGRRTAVRPVALRVVPEVRQFLRRLPSALRADRPRRVCVGRRRRSAPDLAYISHGRFKPPARTPTRTTATSRAQIERRARRSLSHQTPTPLQPAVINGKLPEGAASGRGRPRSPTRPPEADKSKMNFASGGNSKAKAWRATLWGAVARAKKK